MREHVQSVVLDDLDRPLIVAGGERVIDCVTDESMLGEPLRGDAVQLCHPIRLIPLQPVPEELGEQVVVAEPLVVDAVQEQITLFDLLEHLQSPWHPGQGGREIPTDLIGDGGSHQEVERRRFQCVEHVLGEKLTDRVMADRSWNQSIGTGRRNPVTTTTRAAAPQPSRRWTR